MRLKPEDIDKWRVIPRGILVLFGFVFWFVTQWFMGLEDPNMAQAAFVSSIIGAATAFSGLYLNSGSSYVRKAGSDVE